jgi:predicted anti-sigma-YlaC factor YlaD
MAERSRVVNSDIHERARLLIALSRAEEVPNAEQSWLAAHLESCAPCRQFAENAGEAIRSLRAIPVAAGASLVSATQLRVRQRAIELERRQERLWVVWICCVAVTLATAATTAALWGGLAWLGQQARLSATVWESCLIMFCLTPAILAAILLLARGIHLADRNGS